jgi:hypothetical protein
VPRDDSALTLGQRQRLFVRLVGYLIEFAYSHGYELTWGYSRRSKEENQRIGGHPRSAHLRGLAVDLNLFKDGTWLTRSEDHAPLGEYWKNLHPLCCWGGDFAPPKVDGNHYSIEYEGIK